MRSFFFGIKFFYARLQPPVYYPLASRRVFRGGDRYLALPLLPFPP
jgi:hypothetical protein